MHKPVRHPCVLISPERPGQWKGGHRNRPEFLVGFRLAPDSELFASTVTLKRR